MTYEEEQKEYIEFWAKIESKAKETENDYLQLTPSNQVKFINQMNQIMAAGGIESFMKWLKSR